MNALALWVHTPVAQAVGWALIHFLWEGAALAAVLAAALFVLRPPSARVRYAAACLTLFAMPVAFAITLLVLLPGHTAETVTVVPVPNGVAQLSALPSLQAAPPGAGLNFRDLLPWLALCWFAGVAFFYARGMLAWFSARRLSCRGICAPPPDWQGRLTQLSDRLRLSRPARLLESCFTDAPVLVGYLRPVILMPLGCLASLPAGQIECILIHELAHIRRHDYLVNLLQGFVEGLLFYHPAVWWASRVAREERENCCDDCVVEITGDARVYASTLAALEHRRARALETAVAATGGNLMKRIRRLLTEPQPAQPTAAPGFAAGLLLVTCAAALAAWPAKPLARHAIPTVALQARLLESQTIEPQSSPLSSALRESQAARQGPSSFFGLVNFFSQSSTQAAPPQRKGGDETAQRPITTPYQKWLNEDVAYIITDEERAAFLRLQADEEREHFIEQFWLRRDPTPDTVENEFREEHYRRIAYANEHFASRIPGWKTDRGRIYITYGPPDEIEDHSSGGDYQRPASQGGGTTSTFPFQQWRYRYIEGIGNNVIIEFVDPTMTGEFRMTMDPSEKDELRYVHLSQPPAGQPNSAAPARTAKVFRSDQDHRITIATGGGPDAGKGATRLNTLIITPDPVAGQYHISAEVTTMGGQTVQVVAQNAQAELSGPFVEWLELPAGSYILRATITDPNRVSKSSETRFMVD